MRIERVLEARINDYQPSGALEQENVLAELMQHYVLAALPPTTSRSRMKKS